MLSIKSNAMHVRKGLIKNEMLFHKLHWALIPKPLGSSIKGRWRVIIAINFQFKQLEGRSLKNIRASTGFESVTSVIPVRIARPNELWSHTLGARSICWVHTFPCSEMMNFTFIFHIISLPGNVWTQQIDPFQKWRHVTWFREEEDKHQNKSYVSEHRFKGNLEVFA